MKPGRPERRRRAAAIAIPLLLFVSLVSWAFASPVGSSPDDNFHLASIWCGQGEREGLCEQSGDPATRMVPAPVVTAPCFAFQPEQSAACWNSSEAGLSEATWLNTGPLYPPLFYGTMSVFASQDVAASVIAMRIFNSAFAVGLLSAMFFALPRRIRPALLVSTLAAAVPLGMFVLSSTNPSSWAFLSAATVWVGLYGATQTTGRRQVVLAALAVFGAVIGAGSRADAAAFAVFGVILAGILGARKGKALVIPAIAAAVITIASLAFYFGAGQGASLASGLPNANPPLTLSQHVSNFLGVPALWFGAFGDWGLGWLDMIPPAVVTAFAFAVFCAAVFIGIHRLTLRRAVAVALAFAALWLVPFVLLAQSRAVVGTEVQPRYLLPLIVILLGVASLTPSARSEWRGPRFVTAALALSFAMSLSLHYNIRRYTTGVDSNAIDPGADAEWWWSLAPSPLTVWLLGSAAFAAALALLWIELRRRDNVAPTSPAVDTTSRA